MYFFLRNRVQPLLWFSNFCELSCELPVGRIMFWVDDSLGNDAVTQRIDFLHGLAYEFFVRVAQLVIHTMSRRTCFERWRIRLRCQKKKFEGHHWYKARSKGYLCVRTACRRRTEILWAQNKFPHIMAFSLVFMLLPVYDVSVVWITWHAYPGVKGWNKGLMFIRRVLRYQTRKHS